MKWTKSPDFLVQAFDHCLPIVAGVQRKAMFGYPCAFMNGHLFCGLHQDSLIVRLSDARQQELIAQGARVFEPMPGRPMNDYVVAPPEIVADREQLRALLHEALDHASGLEPKEQATARSKPASSTKKAPAPKKVAAAKRRPAGPKKASAKKAPARRAAAKKTSARKAPKAAKKAAGKKTARKTRAPAKTAARRR